VPRLLLDREPRISRNVFARATENPAVVQRSGGGVPAAALDNLSTQPHAAPLPNQLASNFPNETAVAKLLGVQPVRVSASDPAFIDMARKGPIKWVVRTDGGLYAIPKNVWENGIQYELFHPVAAGDTGPVFSAGEATINVTGNAQSGFSLVGNEINRWSGHYVPTELHLPIGVEAFEQAGIKFGTINPVVRPGLVIPDWVK
jgi:hypothetical protein